MIQTVLLFAIIKSVHLFCLNYTFTDSSGVLSSSFSPDQSTLAIPHTGGTASFWDKNTKTLKYAYPFGVAVDSISYSKNGKYIAVSGSKSAISILNSTTYAILTTINTISLGGSVYKTDFRFDDSMLLVCGYSSNI
jgi:WD40 repeat protein